MNIKIATLALTLAASGGVAATAAEGEYYDGISGNTAQPGRALSAGRLKDHDRTFFFPGAARAAFRGQDLHTGTINSGDYYEGAVRPN